MTAASHSEQESKWRSIIVVLAYAIFFLFNAWASDDAYITFRVIDNFINGHGLVWNVGERVQAYTHPLWLFAVAMPAFLTGEIYYTAIAVSALLCFLTLAQLQRTFWPNKSYQLLALAIVLSCSKAFSDYSSSGLEAPLLYFLLTAFFIEFCGVPGSSDTQLTAKSIKLLMLASLVFLTRMDAVLLVLPACSYILYQHRKESLSKICRSLSAGVWPAVVWLIFATIYYGFPFPNTAYAKLGTGIPLAELLHQSIYYYQDSLLRDPVTLPLIFLGVVVASLSRISTQRLTALGIVLYLAYVCRIGGDFMSGRFFAVPFLASAILLLYSYKSYWNKISALGALAYIVLALLIPPNGKFFNGVTDEKAYYCHYSCFVFQSSDHSLVQFPWYRAGNAARSSAEKVTTAESVGFYAFAAGPEKQIIDLNGLADPLLARLPVSMNTSPDGQGWRIGHFKRALPEGYLDSLRSGKNKIADPNLSSYYQTLRDIVSGSILSAQRVKSIVLINLGYFDKLIQAYSQNATSQDLAVPAAEISR